MKKLILVLSLFFAIAVSAQSNHQKKEVKNETKKELTSSAFTGVNLTTTQKTKIKALNNQGLSNSSYNSKMKRILNKSQYNQYLANTNKKETSYKATSEQEKAKAKTTEENVKTTKKEYTR